MSKNDAAVRYADVCEQIDSHIDLTDEELDKLFSVKTSGIKVSLVEFEQTIFDVFRVRCIIRESLCKKVFAVTDEDLANSCAFCTLGHLHKLVRSCTAFDQKDILYIDGHGRYLTEDDMDQNITDIAFIYS